MLIKNVRLNYVHLAAPHKFKETGGKPQEPKYGVTAFFPKNHPQIDEIKKTIRDAVKAKWGDKPPAGLWNPLRDGDNDQYTQDLYAGCYFLNARNTRAVAVVDANVAPMPKEDYDGDDAKWGSGDYGNIFVDAFGFDTVLKGVSLSLQGVQFVRKGERILGSRKAVDQMFTKEEGAPSDDSDIFA